MRCDSAASKPRQEDLTHLPRIVPAHAPLDVTSAGRHYLQGLKQTLKWLLPEELFTHEVEEVQAEQFLRLLPLIRCSELPQAPCEVTFYLLSRSRPNAFKFFFEMVSRWLVPGKRLEATLFHAQDFVMPDLGRHKYTLCEMSVAIESQSDMELVRQNLPLLETEIALGAHSLYHARRILEIKGLAADEKTAMVQEHITYLVKRLPAYFGADIFSEMQHILVVCRDDFKALREYRHLARIITYHYLFKNSLKEKVQEAPSRRHLSLKLSRVRLHLPDRVKVVWGVLVAINFLRDNEVFEERHLIKAIQNYVPNVRLVEGSIFSTSNPHDSMSLLYLEVEKSDGTTLSFDEVGRLRRELPTDLKDRIGHLMHPVFMPPNEEEVMRNMLTLSNQLRYTRDLPQVMITFDQQTDLDVSFLVIMARVLRADSQPLQQMFRESDTILKYLPDRCKITGVLRKKYSKEANVFRVRLPKADYLRSDYSLDLQRARQVVVDEFTRVVGEFRDFNGGMISKQNELFCNVRALLGGRLRGNDFLLENFFYSLSPPIMRSVMEPEALHQLFLELLEVIDEGFFAERPQVLRVTAAPRFMLAVVSSPGKFFREDISRALGNLGITSVELACTFVTVYEVPYVGYIYRCDDPERRQLFKDCLERVLSVPQSH